MKFGKEADCAIDRSLCKETWTMKGNLPLDSITDGPQLSLPRHNFKSPPVKL